MPVETLDELKRQISLLDYLQAHDWRPARRLSGGRWMGMCPLRREHNPSFMADPNKGLFYCHGCGRGEHLRYLHAPTIGSLSGNLERRYTNFWYPKGAMSALNGDKARFHRERKSKLARRERIQALRKKLAVPETRRPDGRDL